MRFPMRALAFAPLCAIAMLAAAPPPFGIERGSVAGSRRPAPDPTIAPSAFAKRPVPRIRGGAIGGPPDGTYTYELLRNGVVRGSTTIAVYHRAERSEIETNEVGHFGAATANVVASFAYADYATQEYIATYRAPFTRDMPLGRVDPVRPHVAFDAATTVRYDVSNRGVRATVDGVDASYIPEKTAPAPGRFAPFVVDAPFMTSVMLISGFQRRAKAADISWYSLAFPQTIDESTPVMSATFGRIATRARFPKTPKRVVSEAIAGLGTIWYDPIVGVVYEAHFDALNVDANLTAFAHVPEAVAVSTPQPIVVPMHLASRAVTIPSGNARLGAVLDLPSGSASSVPAVVLVPPGPTGDRNFDDTGPTPMFVDLAGALTARGFAVLRYDPRGTAGATKHPSTWEDARADARAAVVFAQAAPGIDSSRVFTLGYGNGADFALAAADATGVARVAGVVAIAPTTMKYRECARKRNADVSHPTAWQRSAFGRDPTKLAARATVPLFILHPAIAICGESPKELAAYDDALRAASPRATIVFANELSQFFGSRNDVDSLADTEEFFPYRFDSATLGAIVDWIVGPPSAIASPTATPSATPLPAPTRRPSLFGRRAPRVQATPTSPIAPTSAPQPSSLPGPTQGS